MYIVTRHHLSARGVRNRRDTAVPVPPLLEITPELAAAAALVAEADAAAKNTSAVLHKRGTYWMQDIERKGTSPWGDDADYKVSTMDSSFFLLLLPSHLSLQSANAMAVRSSATSKTMAPRVTAAVTTLRLLTRPLWTANAAATSAMAPLSRMPSFTFHQALT